MKILYVLPRSPWPPYAGQARVAFNRAKHLRRLGHDVFLFSYGQNISLNSIYRDIKSSSSYVSAAIYSFNFLSLFLDFPRYIVAWLFNSLPLVSLLYTPRVISRLFGRHLSSSEFDIIHFYSINSYPLWEIASKAHIPFVVDLVDSMTLNLSGRMQSIPPLLRWIFSREFSCIKYFETNLPVYPKCFAYFVVGTKDALFLALSSDSGANVKPKIVCHSIGVDVTELESPGKLETDQHSFDILLFGSLYYYPNVEAAVWFADEVCPLLLDSFNFNFLIAGAKPSKVLFDLADKYPYVRLLPNPLDMNSLVSSSAITVAPMRSGSGQQFKIIESLALFTPVVATSLAATPLGLNHNEQLLVSDTARDFADSIKLLLSDCELYDRLARSGYAFAKENFSWTSKCHSLEDFYAEVTSKLNP